MVFVFAQTIILTVLAMLQKIPGWFVELNIITLLVGLARTGKAAGGMLKIGIFYF